MADLAQAVKLAGLNRQTALQAAQEALREGRADALRTAFAPLATLAEVARSFKGAQTAAFHDLAALRTPQEERA